MVADLKRVRDEAGNEYVALQGALLRASVKHYLTSDGTLWDSMPLKKELRDATYDMAFALVLVMNQVVSHATTSVHDVRPLAFFLLLCLDVLPLGRPLRLPGRLCCVSPRALRAAGAATPPEHTK